MITLIGGIPGVGKSALMAWLWFKKVTQESFSDYIQLKREIKQLNNNGFCLDLPPQRHLCYSDIPYHFGKITSYYVDGYKLGLDNPFYSTIFLPPYSTIFLDEAQRYYDSRMSKYLRPEVYRWFQLHRHNDYSVFMTCQRIANIDLNIRALAEVIWVIDKLEIKKDKYGFIQKLVWTIREFNSCDTAEQYQMSVDKNEKSNFGKVKKIEAEHNIFANYNSKSCRPVFYENKYNSGFDYYTTNGYSFSLESFVDYNASHYFVAPKGFYINSSNDKKILENLGVNYD